MFEYNPLIDTLKSNGKTLDDLCEEVGFREGVLKQKLNGSENVSIAVLDKICSNLKCQPNDVIRWKEGEMQSSKRISVNWDKVKKLCHENAISLNDLSACCKLDRTALPKAMRRGSSVKHFTLELMCKKLNCNPDEIKLDAN